MARRGSLATTPSRIFTRRSHASRILGAILLTLSVCVTFAGLATAIYLERLVDSPLAPALPAVAEPGSAAAAATAAAAVAVSDARGVAITAPAESTGRDPLAAAAAVPPRAALALPAEPQAGTTTPPAAAVPPQTAMLEAPPPAPALSVATPAPTAPMHRYWVEYGVFVGERYAKRLQQALADRGLDAVVVPTRTPDGRPLVRVRSAPHYDAAQAQAAAESAHGMLKIGPLVHRVAALRAPAAATTRQAASASSRRYWVQFGAFAHRHQAGRLQSALGRRGVETIISAARGTSGKPLFYVRSVGFSDRQSAAAAARRGQEAAKVDFLIGRSIARSASRAREAVPARQPQVARKAG